MPGRTGQRMYSGFFGNPLDSCVQILNSRDTRALDDCCMWLHFKVCPQESKRILSQVPYSLKPMGKKEIAMEFPELPSSIDEDIISTDPPKWWILRQLGDSCLKYEYFRPNEDYAQVVYISMDSSEIFYRVTTW